MQVMKRRADDAGLDDPPTPEPYVPQMQSGVLAQYTQMSEAFSFCGKEQILISELKVKKDHSGHRCVRDVDTKFYLRVVGRKVKKSIGYLFGQTIDRIAKDPDQPSQTLFVSELLGKCKNRPMLHTCEGQDLDETEVIMQHIFDRDGTLREEYQEDYKGYFRRSGPKLHFIPEFRLEPDFRGCGLAKMALHSHLRGIQKLEGDHKFKGLVLLSPAALEPKAGEYPPSFPSRPLKTLLEAEYALIRSYENMGFALWTKGDDAKGGSAITIMGQTISGPKFRTLRTEPLSREELIDRENEYRDMLSRQRRADSVTDLDKGMH